jgi:hypothetical protein
VGLIVSVRTGEGELHQVCDIDAEGTVCGVLEGGLWLVEVVIVVRTAAQVRMMVTLEDSSEDRKP